MQLGHSKDHRDDLPQFKLMAAAAEPSGLFLAGDAHPGNAASQPAGYRHDAVDRTGWEFPQLIIAGPEAGRIPVADLLRRRGRTTPVFTRRWRIRACAPGAG